MGPLVVALVALVPAWPRPVTITVESPPQIGPLSVFVGVGDVDGDGTEDLVVGAPTTVNRAAEAGWIGLWRGGPQPRLMWQRAGVPGERFGAIVAAAGDVDGDLDGDAFADVAIAVPDVGGGRVEVYLGSPDGLGAERRWVNTGAPGSRYGAGVDGVGDVDGDGRADLAVVSFPGGVGKVTVHRGAIGGLEARVWAEVAGDEVGWAGDMDGDGLAELVVGDALGVRVHSAAAPASDAFDPGAFAGVGDVDGDGFMDVAIVRSGGLTIVCGGVELTEVVTGIAAERVAAAGDMNGDGYADLVITRGDVIAFVIGGALLEPGAVREVTSLTLTGLLGPVGVGDLDGDGFGDVAFGRGGGVQVIRGVGTGLGTEPIRLVTRIRGAGGTAPLDRVDLFSLDAADLDADGFSDIVVGSRWAGDGAGRADIYAGGPGLEREAGWWYLGVAGDTLGLRVVAGGDHDGDGFEDAWLGARDARSVSFLKAGYLQLVRGGADGPSLGRRIIGGDHEGLGGMLGATGDLDADGRAELAVLLSGGEILLFFGDEGPRLEVADLGSYSERQRPIIGDLDGDGRDEIVAGHKERSVVWLEEGALRFVDVAPVARDAIVAGAGDVDGDGDIEMIEVSMNAGCAGNGAYGGTAGIVYGGGDYVFGPRVELYAGPTCPGWSADAAGDVDGDGYGDLLVADPITDDGARIEAGAVHLHLGTAAGVALEPSWTVFGDRSGRRLGSTVAGAGDIDGDGFADVVVAGAQVETGEADDALVQVYRGNGGLGTTSAWHYAVSARQPDIVTPLAVGGRSTSPGAFRVRAIAASPFGHRVALEVEAKPHGTPFDGRGLVRSDFGDAGDELVALVDGLTVDTGYSWRARLKTHPALGPRQAASHWIYGGRPGEPRSVHLRTRANRPPTAMPFEATLVGSPFLRLAPGVLKGATDPDSDPLVARLGRPPVHGVADIRPDGTLLYEPDPAFAGVERFTYIASDGLGGETEAPIELTVPGPGSCGLVSDAACLQGDVFLVVRLDDGTLASIHCVVTAEGEPDCDEDENGELVLGEPVCGF